MANMNSSRKQVTVAVSRRVDKTSRVTRELDQGNRQFVANSCPKMSRATYHRILQNGIKSERECKNKGEIREGKETIGTSHPRTAGSY